MSFYCKKQKQKNEATVNIQIQICADKSANQHIVCTIQLLSISLSVSKQMCPDALEGYTWAYFYTRFKIKGNTYFLAAD